MSETETVPSLETRPAGAPPIGSKVYVVQGTDNGKYERAKRYGTLVYLMERDAFPDNAEERIDHMHHTMHAALFNFNPARDWILLTGDPVAIAMCILVLSQWTLHIPCLKWDRQEQEYYAVTIYV
jgi:hypothetical protein